MDVEKRPQNGAFLIENWHLTDSLVYESIFQTKISLLPYVFVRLALKLRTGFVIQVCGDVYKLG